MRLRADIWVAAYLRRRNADGAFAALRRRGAAEAGAIVVKLDRLDGRAALYGPAPQSLSAEAPPGVDRVFTRMHDAEWIDPAEAEARLARQVRFDPDLWIVEVEDRNGEPRIDLVS
ncbi:hypothetical protein DFR50_1053 [Roseiarcus fermentans]|uniref:DUF1491 family protein n=1 Tax=Roseiarcus fermentans TaxID=1473586 RepID=A0A366FNZ4_9HYPH|nr:DUF1491 family protein [Roseiarcus fermentans]RBP16362.1 hypothetical protein DFR50_1053 [Roseiarcus fermentans]